MGQHPVDDRGQMASCGATQACEGRPVQIDAAAFVDMALAVKRQMVRIFGHGHMGERAFGGQSAFDQPPRCVRLQDACIAAAAGIAGADGDDHLEAGRNNVQPFGTAFADLHLVGAAAGAGLLRGFEHLLDPRQVVWQMAEIALGRRSRLGCVGIADGHRITNGCGLSDSRLQVFEIQLPVIGVQLCRPLAIKRMAQFRDQVILALVMCLKPRELGLHGQKRLPHAVRKIIQIHGLRGRRGHPRSYRITEQKPMITRRSESFCRGWNGGARGMDAVPVQTGKQRLQLRARQPYDPVADLQPGKSPPFPAACKSSRSQTCVMVDRTNGASMAHPKEDPYPVTTFGPEHRHHARLGRKAQLGLRHGGQAVMTLAQSPPAARQRVLACARGGLVAITILTA